ncbi:MAG: anthranilate phosphoribosyltransferase [Gammaproteobacteria bacterium]|nr:anthranilate phosphoribosyltransferase [Gammaproteobacteria bacterium]
MDIQHVIGRVIEGDDLSDTEMTGAMRAIMAGEATPAQIAGLLVGLRMKGETVTEITAAARVMRELAMVVETPFDNLIDIVGTGGDGAGTFNVSTACAFVAAAAGARVGKHGNRSVSSRSGSADVLEAFGVRVDLEPAQIAECIATVGVGFMFAPRHHGAMRHALAPRRELGVRTLFNLLGPLSNPAGARHLLLGVFGPEWVAPLAEVAGRLGARRVLVVHSEDGLDEFSVSAATRVAELRDGEVRSYVVTPEQFGLVRSRMSEVCVGDADESRALIREIFAGRPGPARDIVVLNAGAALYTAGIATDIAAGSARAAEIIDSGAARTRLDALVALTQRMKP